MIVPGLISTLPMRPGWIPAAPLWPVDLSSDSTLCKSFDLLETKRGVVPFEKFERRRSLDLFQFSDSELLEKWTSSTETTFLVRGWYRTLDKDAFRGKKILDFGCGLGPDSILYAEHGMQDLLSLDQLPADYDIDCCGSCINAPLEVSRLEAQSLLAHLPVGGRWIELGYPKTRWQREGCLSVDRWGEKTDGRTPWVEWHDVEKLEYMISPATFEVVLYIEFHNSDFNWFDLLRLDDCAEVRLSLNTGFKPAATHQQNRGKEENFMSERVADTRNPLREPLNELKELQEARRLAFIRPLVPYPGWSFDADWNNPDFAFGQRRRIWEYFNERQIKAPLVFDWYNGLKLNLYLGNDLSRQLFIAGCVEPNEFAFFDQILAPGMVFIDAGANDGIFTLFAAQRVGPQGKVWAFEPSEREFTRLEQNVALNELQNVNAFRVALADTEAEQDLMIAGYEHEGQNTLGGFVHQGVRLMRTERVAARRLDSLVQEAKLPTVDVIKLDVEGAEHRVIEGARTVLAQFRPVVLFEALDPALRKQGSSRENLCGLLSSLQYRLFTFDETDGLPTPADAGGSSENMIAIPAESSLANRYVAREHGNAVSVSTASPLRPAEKSRPPAFDPARAYWNHRATLRDARERILSLARAVNHPTDLWPYQWAQLMAAVIDFAPDLILELGRGKGNSTCAFTEASNLNQGRSRIVSLCFSDNWERETLPRLREIVSEDWFKPLRALREDILEFNYAKLLSGAKRVLIFWDAHGFDIAECVLGKILPIAAPIEHLVIMHDLSDTRYCAEEQLGYGGYGLWKGNDWSGPRLKLGIIDSAVEQSIAALDFTTRNHITLDSADHSFHTCLSAVQQAEMRAELGELFDTQGHWFYFSLNERPGPYKFPRFSRHVATVKPRR